MVSISAKASTARSATASGRIFLVRFSFVYLCFMRAILTGPPPLPIALLRSLKQPSISSLHHLLSTLAPPTKRATPSPSLTSQGSWPPNERATSSLYATKSISAPSTLYLSQSLLEKEWRVEEVG